MKLVRYILIAGLAGIVGAVVWLGTSRSDRAQSPPNNTTHLTNSAVFGVEQFMRSPAPPTGPVQIEGVVGAVSEGDHRLALIDNKEYAACGITTCAELYLPVRWAGVMPAPSTQVLVEGMVQSEEGKQIFAARSIQPVKQQSGNAP